VAAEGSSRYAPGARRLLVTFDAGRLCNSYAIRSRKDELAARAETGPGDPVAQTARPERLK